MRARWVADHESLGSGLLIELGPHWLFTDFPLRAAAFLEGLSPAFEAFVLTGLLLLWVSWL